MQHVLLVFSQCMASTRHYSNLKTFEGCILATK